MAAFEDILRRVFTDPELHAILLAGDFRPLAEAAPPEARARRAKLVEALVPAVHALDDAGVRLALLFDYMHRCAREWAERPPLYPWEAPQSRATLKAVAARDAGSAHYRAWLMATLADVAAHFQRAVANETVDKSALAANLAVARMLRAAILASHRADLAALEALADSSRLYLQRLDVRHDTLRLTVPEGPEETSSSSASPGVTSGNPFGSVIVIRGEDVVGSTRIVPAEMLIKALAPLLRDGYTEDEAAAIRQAFPGAVPARDPGPASDEDVALGTWSYLKTDVFHQIVMDLPALLPREPDAALLEKMKAAVGRARRAATAAQCDAEDAAERVVRALLRSLGCPPPRVRSLLDPSRKAPPADS